jgi:hypothetical protein
MTLQSSTTHEFDILNDQTLTFNVSKEGLQEADETIRC